MLWLWHHLFLEEKQVLLESKNLDVRKNKFRNSKTYTHDLFNNNTIQ